MERIEYSRAKIFVPDFGQIGELYKQGFGNDIDLALRNRNFAPLVSSNENEIPVQRMPSLSDEQLAKSFVSKEFDTNELCEIAHHSASEYRKQQKSN